MPRKGLGYTQQQWTNLIIFVISALVLLFLFIGKIMEKNIDEQTDRVVELVRIDFGGLEIWREQQNWLSSSAQLQAVEIQAIADRWQSLVNKPGETYQSLPSGGRTVLLYFSTVAQPVVCKVINRKGSLLIAFITTQQLIELPSAERSLYFPEVS
ncbi:hypothetical protein FLL45_06670 [Aliikangiella marina]|uniref:Uncharacterized protein n=1 Tax=Aliikangiella marina TaxID=1712262 RepID=A0A545TBR6_9GAMM|nr:hypothetical protein [Aliikangiella marina]TQV74641.1 hypothetical protein FLL45_06670 [Aliikangiella marina]